MWKFIKSSSSKDNWFKHNGSEACFLGRSNVGKSSLLNALANQKIARTSNTPGRTRLVNFFESDSKKIIVDLPGYGYAKMSKVNQIKLWKMINEYISEREQLNMIFLLIDSRRGIQEEEIEIMKTFNDLKKAFTLVFTKVDKINQSQLHKIKQEVSLLEFNPEVVYTSSEKRKNIKNLLSILEQI
ncbi:GTP-binding protein [Mycoplasma testudineum]|uniref:Probable GTP-binding protein EngB n=1 Tax=Mycoplasma testudineum TaxID=244584 RepID=A0A4R6IFR8_9MOLU|nr:ribosome biogenesis GTP-binding protein YihA/YsxC [Mycoplasma testudineum]OYD26990.1 YihA family ribosome biogenesis GTP-binding protein [Mycoplasma testudineum]TDO20538.1 GTP-binding protein [Mycoplasma testudineum]